MKGLTPSACGLLPSHKLTPSLVVNSTNVPLPAALKATMIAMHTATGVAVFHERAATAACPGLEQHERQGEHDLGTHQQRRRPQSARHRSKRTNAPAASAATDRKTNSVDGSSCAEK